MISSASAQIEAVGGANLKKTVVRDGKVEVIPDYVTVQGIFVGAIATFVIIGPENHGSNFEQQGVAFEDAAPADAEKDPVKDLQSEEIGEKF